LKNKFPITLLCRILNIDRSNYYSWQKKYNPCKSEEFNQALKEVFELSDKTFGYRRMHIAMKSLGFTQNEKTIRKSMKLLNLHCEIRQKKKFYKKSETTKKCKNYLNQKFYPTKPNSRYSVDITYLQTKKGMVYLNVIIDLFGKIPIAYLSSYNCDSKLACELSIKSDKLVWNVQTIEKAFYSYATSSYSVVTMNFVYEYIFGEDGLLESYDRQKEAVRNTM